MTFDSYDEAVAYLESQVERMREDEAHALARMPYRERVEYLARLEARGAKARAEDLRERCYRLRGLAG